MGPADPENGTEGPLRAVQARDRELLVTLEAERAQGWPRPWHPQRWRVRQILTLIHSLCTREDRDLRL